MNDITKTAGDRVDRHAIRKILDESLLDPDARCRKSLRMLGDLAMDREEALSLLARHKSRVKYGYPLSPDSLSHLFHLARSDRGAGSLRRLLDHPFLLIKTCWLYEHAPHFNFPGGEPGNALDLFIKDFARTYETAFLESRVPTGTWTPVVDPWRVMATTFWEREIIDPVRLIHRAREARLEGVEICFDFHPFNPAKLLPEEIGEDRRREIRDAVMKSGLKVDIHSPIVGPYTPVPHPSRGTQRFFSPGNCLGLQQEVVDLAGDIGAGCVVVHLVDGANLKPLVTLIERAGGTDVRVTIENYCQTDMCQNSDMFIACLDEIFQTLPMELRKRNFGITLDVGHLNIEGEDPLIGAERIGRWCLEKRVYLRMHATDNYGNLLFSPPAYSADVHSNVSGRGVNSALVIKLLRSMGLRFRVVAEQIQPLTQRDLTVIHNARTYSFSKDHDAIVREGRARLRAAEPGALLAPEVIEESAYQFLAGLEGIAGLREYLVYRKIQEKKNLSVDEAKRISQDFIRMPQKLKADITSYIDDLLLPIQSETGAIKKTMLDMVCQNISGAIFATISNEHLNRIFRRERVYGEGEILCEQGAPGHEMYFLKQGRVAVYLDDFPVASLGPGEIFGEMSLFYNIRKSATIKAVTDSVRVGILGRKGLESLLKDGRPYAQDLIYRLYRILPDRLRNLNDKYKAAIRTLHLILDGDASAIPSLDPVDMEIENREHGLFPLLSRDEANEIYQETKQFRRGQAVFSEGDPGDGAYFVIQGRVRVSTHSDDLGEIVLGEVGEGEIFGEMALIDSKPRSATVTAIAPSTMGFIGKQAFNEFIEERSPSAVRLMGFICLTLFRHILRLDRLYTDIKKRMSPGG